MNKIGIIISLEQYINNSVGLPTVKYANADAENIKRIFIDTFKIPPERIYTYINETGTYANCGLHGELAYHLSSLEPDTTIYFYYAGHGFFSGGDNYLTTWDTSTIDLIATSLSINSVFMTLFKRSNARRLIAFIDACAEDIQDSSRSVLTRGIDFNIIEKNYGFEYAFFFSCSPSQKSYSSDSLKHGIWTYYLTKALLTDKKIAIDMDGNITAGSLHAYLSEQVRDYTLKEFKNLQNPYSISASNSEIMLVSSEKPISFDEQIIKLDEELNSRCYLVNIYIGRYEEDDVYENYAILEEICWDITDLLPDDWHEAFNELMYYANRVRNNQPISIPYSEKQQVIDKIQKFINSIDTEEKTYTGK